MHFIQIHNVHVVIYIIFPTDQLPAFFAPLGPFHFYTRNWKGPSGAKNAGS